MTDTFDRTQLDGKDREQLSEIASALGVKAISRMRKADLVEAIVSATSGANGSSSASESRPRKIRSTASGGDDLASLAAEEDSLATGSEPVDEMTLIRPRRLATAGNGSGDAPAPSVASETTSIHEASTPEVSTREGSTREVGSPDSGGGHSHDQGSQNEHGSQSQQLRGDDDGQGNRRRRRRRGRERERPGGERQPGERQAGERQGGERQGGESRESREDFSGELIPLDGLLDLRDEGYGFLRTSGYLAGRNDAYVSASQVRRFGLRKGDYVTGATRPPASSEKYPALVRVDQINGMTTEDARSRVRFEDLTPLFPDSKLRLELDDDPSEITGRIIDLISPIGKGQRGLIVSPPKAGKTTIIKQIVYSIERNNPEVHVMVLLVDERPEEVTDMRRHVQRAEVIASTFDRPSDEHCHVAELAIERARRLVEMGTDVVIVLDGITRLARAYNLAAPASGRIMSGGVDSSALYPPKKFFGSARNIEEGGSLTILATALIDTGSKMDEVIFEEFKGTGNMELRLDRRVADRRIYPAIDVEQSSTRHEELLFDRKDLQQAWKLRRVLNALDGGAGLELLIDKLRSTKSNAEFLNEIAKAPAGMA
ncbi:MAG TPA: transcription termination factor Rho [Acidimicrobiia bacterium]|nr:transcription termination factor Rho [Acidimicrobiia bacterium]